jgi:hypothetical protein
MSRELALTTPQRKLSVRVMLEKPDGTPEPQKDIYVALGEFSSSRVTYVVSDDRGTTIPAPGLFPALKTREDGTASLPFPSGRYELTSVEDLSGTTPSNQYVASARQGHRDALTENIIISDDEDAFVEIRMRRGAGKIGGVVRDSQDRIVANAQVALLPHGPMSASRLLDLRKTAGARADGSFELLGLRPGTYLLYAWQTPGNPYRDSQFMKQYEGKGTPVRVEENGHGNVELRVLKED